MPAQLGKYELLAPLAQGGTAEVFLARLPGTGGFEKVVVVKRLLDHLAEDREFVDMFLDEARLGARLDQSNIVQTIDLGQVEGHYFIAMEYLAGMSLAQLGRKAQQRPGGLPPEVTLALAVQACTGLHYAHECTQADGTPLALVHRDVSPQNLIVTHEGVLKIVDFGIAHAAQEARDARTKAGFIKGKFAYMSPEQCLGKPFDRRTDVFALAVVTHELLTGRRLFKRESTYKTYQAIVNGEVTRPSADNPRLDAAIDAVILKALAPRADDRYANAEAFGEALEGLLHRLGKQGTAGEVARYLSLHFQAEIDQQQQMLHELLAGTVENAPAVAAASWDGDGDAVEEISLVELMESSFDDAAEDSGVEPSMEDSLAMPPVAGAVAGELEPAPTLPVRRSAQRPAQRAPSIPPAPPLPERRSGPQMAEAPPLPERRSGPQTVPRRAPSIPPPPQQPERRSGAQAVVAPTARVESMAPVPWRAPPESDTLPGSTPLPRMPEGSGTTPVGAAPLATWVYFLAFVLAAAVGLGVLLLGRLL